MTFKLLFKYQNIKIINSQIISQLAKIIFSINLCHDINNQNIKSFFKNHHPENYSNFPELMDYIFSFNERILDRSSTLQFNLSLLLSSSEQCKFCLQ